MDELVRWLGEQLDKDEQIAKAATQGEWVWSREFVTPPGYHHRTVGPLEPGDAAFIAAHDPARVLREIEAKRQTLRWHYRRPAPKWDLDGAKGFECATCDQQFPCKTLRLLALPYADQSGYQESWRP